MPFRPDPIQPSAAPSTGRFRPDPVQPSGPRVIENVEDAMPSLPGEPQKFKSAPAPQKPGYLERLSAADEKVKATSMVPGSDVVGTAEAGLSALTGALAPIPAALRAAFRGQTANDITEQDTADFTYSPRSDSGQARAEYLGELLKPTESLAASMAGIVPDVAPAVTGPRIPNARAPKPAPVLSEGQQTLARIREQGIKVTPKEASQITGDKNFFGRALQAIGGDTKVSQDISAANRPVINTMGRKAVGADSLTEKGLKPVKDAGNAVYTEMSSLGKVKPTAELRAAVENARGSAGKSTKRNAEIDKFVDGVLNEFGEGADVDAGQVVNRVRELRRDAQNSRKGEGEKRPTVQQEALGEAQRAVADALDDFLEYSAATAGKTGLAEKYKENRVRLAKVGTVEDATRAGNLDAKKLYEAKTRGAPLTGKLEEVAIANEYAPQSTAPMGSEALMEAPGRNLSILELPVAALQNAARHMGVNKLLQSDFYQDMLGGKQGGPHLAEHDINPGFQWPENMRRQPPAAPPPSIDFAGELGLAPDMPAFESLPGGNVAAPVTGRNIAEALGLQLAEDVVPSNVTGPNALRNSPDEINFEAVTPEQVGQYRIAPDQLRLDDVRPVAGTQRGAAVNMAGDLELLPDAPTGKQDVLPPSPGKPRRGGPPRLPKPQAAPPAPPAAAQPPEGLSELGALIDLMLTTKRGQVVEQPARGVVPGTIAEALGVLADAFPDRYLVPGSKRTSVAPDEGYIATASNNGRRQINDAFVKESSRGKGLGQKNLVKAAEEAQAAGEALDSDVSITPAQARAYLSAQKKGLIQFDITDQKAWDEGLANGTNIKAGGQPVVKNIRPMAVVETE